MWDLLRSQYGKWKRRREADRRGWGSVGNMYSAGQAWSSARWGREIRRRNRMYRIANGSSPWRPFNGF